MDISNGTMERLWRFILGETNHFVWLKSRHMLWKHGGYSWFTMWVGVLLWRVLSTGCEAFGFNLLGKEEWLGWLICQQDMGWLNQGERRGMESFWKGNDGFCFMYLYFKGSKLKSTFLFSILTKGCKENLSFLREGHLLILGISMVIY